MDDEEMTQSDTFRAGEKVKMESNEKSASSPDFIPLQKLSQPQEKESSSVPNQTKGNGSEKNGQKRIKMEEDDGSSKKPRITPDLSMPVKKQRRSTDSDNMSETEEYYLTVSNMPRDWTFVQIKNFLDGECGHVDEMEMLNNAQGCAIRLTFQNLQKCKRVLRMLQNRVVEDKTLIVDLTEPISVFPPGITVPAAPSLKNETVDIKDPLRPWIKDPDTAETVPHNLYGLRPQYLASLNIVPPLTKLVHVTNFRCDKNELKEVMELAGNVLICCVVASPQRYAKVMYNHPLEAVQAISMLNGQMYYGSPLRITMDKSPEETIVLPKGLAGVGLGLGLQGKPIRDIEQQFKKYAENQSSLINPILFYKINSNDNSVIVEDNQEEIQNKMNEFIKSTNCTLLNQTTILKSKNIDQLDVPEANSNDGSARNTPETNVTKDNLGESRKSSVGSLSPNRDPITKNGAEIPNKFNKPLGNLAPTQTPTVRICHNTKGVIRPGLLHNPAHPMHNPMPIPTPGHPNYGPPGPPVPPTNFANQPRPGQFGPRPVPFMPPQRPGFRAPPMPAAFGPQGLRPQMPPASFSGVRPPFVGPNPAVPRPNINPGNRVTVNFSNLPPSTTFPLLCEQLSQCGQVMSVQLTTPGCAVATFGHPSHAERCYQTFNRMNVEGYVIEVKFA